MRSGRNSRQATMIALDHAQETAPKKKTKTKKKTSKKKQGAIDG